VRNGISEPIFTKRTNIERVAQAAAGNVAPRLQDFAGTPAENRGVKEK
jgi:hypothetical protein